MGGKNVCQELILKNIWNKNYCEVEQNELMSKKYKQVCTALNYIEHSLILASAVT